MKISAQLPFDLGHRQAFERDDFWVSKSNQEAVSWVDAYPKWPSPVLVLYGEKSCGKTHLLHVWQAETQAIPFERIGDDLSLPVVLDDIEKYIGDKKAEEKIFHAYNRLKENGQFMLITSQMPPKEWAFTLPDLQSRLMAATAVGMGAPDDELLAVVLTKLFSDRQLFVSQDVVGFILSRIERSFSAVNHFVDSVDRMALAQKRPVTVPLVREWMKQENLIRQGDMILD